MSGGAIVVLDEAAVRVILGEALRSELAPIRAELERLAAPADQAHASEPDRLLRPAEAARFLGLDVRTLRRCVAAGTVPAPTRIGRSVRWSREALAEFVRKGGAA